MAGQNNDPWAEAGNQAVGALYKYYMSKPNPVDMQRSQLENQLLDARIKGENAQLRNADLAFSKGQLDLNQARTESEFANKFNTAYDAVPQVRDHMPTDGTFGPVKPVTQGDRDSEIAGLFEQFAPKLNKDVVEASRGALGAANAMRFNDPIQRQLAIDEKASSYDAMMPGFTLSPGQVRFGADNKEIVSAPFKKGGGSYIQQPDGTIISIDGGAPTELTTSVKTDLQGKDISFDTYRSFTDSYKKAIQDNPGGVGTRGNIARIADGLLGQVNQFAPNTEFSNTLKQIVNTTAGQYTDPQTGQIMNADLYDAATTASLLPFVAAEAIVGQGGRSLSNEDRDLVKAAVGGPEDWLATPDKLMARMNQLDRIVENLRQKYQGRLMGQRPMTPAPEADNLQMGSGGVVKWTVDENGNPVPVGGQ